jgi:hypothetical protein
LEAKWGGEKVELFCGEVSYLYYANTTPRSLSRINYLVSAAQQPGEERIGVPIFTRGN